MLLLDVQSIYVCFPVLRSGQLRSLDKVLLRVNYWGIKILSCIVGVEAPFLVHTPFLLCTLLPYLSCLNPEASVFLQIGRSLKSESVELYVELISVSSCFGRLIEGKVLLDTFCLLSNSAANNLRGENLHSCSFLAL
jgi:hypothetical protein